MAGKTKLPKKKKGRDTLRKERKKEAELIAGKKKKKARMSLEQKRRDALAAEGAEGYKKL